MGRVENKVAIVTGAASGLGFAAAQKLMSEGAKVMLSDINQEIMETMPERLSNFSNTQFSTYTHDVTKEDDWIDIIDKTEQEFGKINILVNSAGISLGSDIVSTDFEIWKKVHEVNLDSVFLGCKYAIPKLNDAGSGSIINISSIASFKAASYPGLPRRAAAFLSALSLRASKERFMAFTFSALFKTIPSSPAPSTVDSNVALYLDKLSIVSISAPFLPKVST